MSFTGCSGSFSSRSFGGCLQYPVSSCGSSYPSNLVYSTDLQVPITSQLGSSFSGCQETFCAPRSCQAPCVASRPCQRPCYRPRTSTFCSPCQTTFSGPLGLGSRGFQSFDCGFPSLGFGAGSFQSSGCGSRTFSSLNCRPDFCRPTYFSSRSCQSVSYQPSCGSGFY